MSSVAAPRVSKWPFLLGDALLVALAVFLVWRAPAALDKWQAWAVVACVGLGCWLAVQPFLRDHEAVVKLLEQTNLAGTLEQIQQLKQVGAQIASATSQWQAVQESAAKTTATAGEIAGRIQAEKQAFAEFQSRAMEQEKQTLKLELEKLRRNEGEFLQVIIHVLDHTYALFQAGARSGQPGLVAQLGNFRAACLDAVRRIGIVAHEAQSGDAFDGRVHQTFDGQPPVDDSRVGQTVACGYTFQGQALRRIVVTTGNGATTESEQTAAVADPGAATGPAETVGAGADDGSPRELL
jgi:molecular chaperone GrpE (heat shock protein)